MVLDQVLDQRVTLIILVPQVDQVVEVVQVLGQAQVQVLDQVLEVEAARLVHLKRALSLTLVAVAQEVLVVTPVLDQVQVLDQVLAQVTMQLTLQCVLTA